MKLSEQVSNIIDEANSISCETILNVVNLNLIEEIEIKSNSDPYLLYVKNEMNNICQNLSIDEIKKKSKFFNLYSEATIYLDLKQKFDIERLPEGDGKKPDFKITFNNKEYYIEIKSLMPFDVFNKDKNAQDESLNSHIEMEKQFELGNKVFSCVRYEQPYYKCNDEYNSFSRAIPIEIIIDKIEQNIKPGQFELGESILVVDLGRFIIPCDVTKEILPKFYDPQFKSCSSGILWHIAFGKQDMQIYNSDYKHSVIEKSLNREGVLITHNKHLHGIVFYVRKSDKCEYACLFIDNKSDDNFKKFMEKFSSIYNDEKNSYESSL